MASKGEQVVNAAKSFLKNKVKKFVGKIAGMLATNPIFWIVLAIIFVIMIVAGMFTTIAESDDSDDAEEFNESEMGTSDMNGSTSSEGFEQLLRWLGIMEHGVDISTYDKDYYEFLSDGFGGVAILGLDTRYYGDYFSGLGYSTSPGSQVPRDIVEQKFRDVVQGMYDEVKNIFNSSGCNLTEYQLYAMTARRYNWGHIADNDVSSYKAYWNQSTDDMFEQKKKEGDYTHKYFTNCLCEPSKDGVLTGRRKSEWTLFQCGYFDAINEWYVETTASGDASGIIESAHKIHKYMEANNYSYR